MPPVCWPRLPCQLPGSITLAIRMSLFLPHRFWLLWKWGAGRETALVLVCLKVDPASPPSMPSSVPYPMNLDHNVILCTSKPH